MVVDHDTAMAQLHTRSVRGEPLSVDEQAHLALWYAAQDAAEAEVIRIPTVTSADLMTLQHELDSAMMRLDQATRDVQKLHQQNAVLRQQIIALEVRLRDRIPSAA